MASHSKLRIAQVAPLWESVPPQGYGGVELVVSLLSDGLAQRGHEVTLFASGDSSTQAKLQAMAPQAMRKTGLISDYPCYEMQMLSQVLEQQDTFDIIHFHDRCTSFAFSPQLRTPSLHTLHYSLEPAFKALYRHYAHLAFVHISQAQKKQMPDLPSFATVYNGIRLEDFPFQPQTHPSPYLAFIGRISEPKGAHLAIEVAQKTNMPLKMAGKVDEENCTYFETVIQPHIDGEQIQYLGEVPHQQKVHLMGNAIATLFPIIWDEPFGLVMIESMACGTPVLGLNRASTPEIIKSGETGFICDTVDDMCAAVAQLSHIDRPTCRQHVAQTFSADNMIKGYEQAYWKLCQTTLSPGAPQWHPISTSLP